MAYITLLLATAFAFLIALFAVQNSMMVSVNLLTWTVEASLVLVILGAAALGFLMALSLQLYAQMKLKFQLYKANSRIRQLEGEIGRLTPAPAAPAAVTPETPTVEKRQDTHYD